MKIKTYEKIIILLTMSMVLLALFEKCQEEIDPTSSIISPIDGATFEQSDTIAVSVDAKGHNGAELKTTTGWLNRGNGNDPYGFSALPGGARQTSSTGVKFTDFSKYAYWWTSSSNHYNNFYICAYISCLTYESNARYKSLMLKYSGISVRCIMDDN